MATNPNMVAIQTVTVSATSAANIEFTNIPQGYTDLVVKTSIRDARTGDIFSNLLIRFNGSSSNLSSRRLFGNGSGVSSSTAASSIVTVLNGPLSTSNTFSSGEFYIPNYTSANNKSVSTDIVTENNATESYQELNAGLWSDSSAITSITLLSNYGVNLVQHSTATLYGVTKFGEDSPKAVGGAVTSDSNYYYHTFTNSGNFVPTVNLTADYLVVAGGGGGGGRPINGGGTGGGGAGGYRYLTDGSFTSATTYTVIVGAGGVGGAGSGENNGVKGSNSQISGSGFTTRTSTGGGFGPGYGFAAGTGGSGGGGAQSGAGVNGAAGNEGGFSPVEGFAGGNGLETSTGAGGGGGGAGGAGSNSNSDNGGNGGVGVQTSIGGTSLFYAGGGGGGGASNGTTKLGGTGGSGVGGTGYNPATSTAATNGAASRGGGGGGGGNATQAGNGGSGIVIIRYAK
jgi:hypothetical protein